MRFLVKKILLILSKIHSLYYIFLYKVGCNYKNVGISISKINGIYGIYLRRKFYEKTLNKCGKNLKIHHGSYVCYPSVDIGNNCTVEEDCVISNCTIGNDVIIAANVSLMSGKNHHDISDITKTFYETQTPHLDRIFLGDNLWIGTRSTIMANINDGTVVAAGAVVTKDFLEKNIVIAGVPAKLIKSRD